MTSNPLKPNLKIGQIQVNRFAPSQPGPLLVIVPSIFGCSPDVIAHSQVFCNAGALVYVIDSFWRTHPGPLNIPGDAEQALNRMSELDPNDAFSDLLAVLDFGAKDRACNGSSFVLGICFGGKFAMKAPQERSLKGIAVWHGARMLPWLNVESIRPIMASMDFGEIDPMIPLTEVDVWRTHFDQVHHAVRVHPNCGHGFTHIGTRRGDNKATQSAVEGVLNLLRSSLSML